MNDFTHAMVTILVGIITVALVAVVVSRNANTSDVLSSFFKGFNGALGAATGPVLGGGFVGASFANANLTAI